jgi:hypothetical protein
VVDVGDDGEIADVVHGAVSLHNRRACVPRPE